MTSLGKACRQEGGPGGAADEGKEFIVLGTEHRVRWWEWREAGGAGRELITDGL